jgi:fatty acid amide hydrolase
MTGAVTSHSAAELATLIRNREVSSTEAVGAFIERLTAVNPTLNAVIVERFEEALDEATAADREIAGGRLRSRLHGVPITVKETLSVSGTHECAGVESLSRVASKDANVVQRLRSAGAIVLGKTNVSQFLWFNEADNPMHGRSNNPWRLARTTGGSSGGEGAIIASGGSPVGMGTDSGGSARSPAHFCGIQALKPTSGLLSTAGSLDDVIFGGQEDLNQPCPMGRTTDDLELMLEILVAPGGRWDEPDRWSAGNAEVRLGVDELRIGYFRSCPGYAVSEPVLRALEVSLHRLEQAGCKISEVEPPDLERCMGLFDQVFAADGGDTLRHLAQSSDLDPRVETTVRGASALRLTVEQYWNLLSECKRFTLDTLRQLDVADVDVVVCPPDAGVAFEHGASPEMARGQAYVALFNLLGLPAGVVNVLSGDPALIDSGVDQMLRTTDQGMPVGVQIVGRYWQEKTVLCVMRALENLVDKKYAPPPIPLG